MNSKIKRNDPCPCGSGKKYKRCCMTTNMALQNLEFIAPSLAIKKCSWCHKIIEPNEELFGLKAKAAPELDIDRFAGKAFYVPLLLAGKKIIITVPTIASPARQEDVDMIMAVCSMDCGLDLKNSLREDKEFIGQVLGDF